jgi:hypothetical protein
METLNTILDAINKLKEYQNQEENHIWIKESASVDMFCMAVDQNECTYRFVGLPCKIVRDDIYDKVLGKESYAMTTSDKETWKNINNIISYYELKERQQ